MTEIPRTYTSGSVEVNCRVVMPARAGIQVGLGAMQNLDSRLRGNDRNVQVGFESTLQNQSAARRRSFNSYRRCHAFFFKKVVPNHCLVTRAFPRVVCARRGDRLLWADHRRDAVCLGEPQGIFQRCQFGRQDDLHVDQHRRQGIDERGRGLFHGDGRGIARGDRRRADLSAFIRCSKRRCT